MEYNDTWLDTPSSAYKLNHWNCKVVSDAVTQYIRKKLIALPTQFISGQQGYIHIISFGMMILVSVPRSKYLLTRQLTRHYLNPVYVCPNPNPFSIWLNEYQVIMRCGLKIHHIPYLTDLHYATTPTYKAPIIPHFHTPPKVRVRSKALERISFQTYVSYHFYIEHNRLDNWDHTKRLVRQYL